ncbi:tripartite tricarboxylate transporter permease [Chelatococcus asaccharovorans]|uniref:TctA family transporter n=1 Tax=Chelatococcus asaccharovorans TaxID=28210 RepID=A0A2V3UB28_9HYPH|nr:tripartite tricarboxylate transporter permease [Chelatococcus asaccharovorans]MBS7705517.1 tripartite tricarboxylate transporter permease [Chelatococcus asaccharovorans]PXW60078.1 TctA family transporter [Chelatococcus asaccharovorans]
MDFIQNLGLGFSVALLPYNLLFCFIGCFLGTAIGVLPGIGPLGTIAILLPVTFGVSPEAALIMLAGIYYGAQYGGSTTAILINLPGEATSAVTAIDGYQMARQGRAGTALAVAALGSFFAGTVATLAIAIFAKPLTSLALSFSPADYFALMVLGLVASIALAHGSVLKGLAMILLGLLLGCVGTDSYTGAMRFTLGTLDLADGIPIVAFGAGIYALGEILRGIENESDAPVSVIPVNNRLPSLADLKEATAPVVRGTLLGSVLGVLPGGGALLSAFTSYAMEKKLSRTPERFGHGAMAGVAGPESANNAGAQTSFIPMLTLGIPSNPIMALMVGALILQGIIPGPNLITEQPKLFWGVIASMWVGNLILVILNLPLIGLWLKLLKIRPHFLFPTILGFSMIGVYSVGNSAFDLYLMAIFGAAGYVLGKLDCEPAPMLLGFVLGPLLEEYLRRAMILADGDATVLIQRPLSATLLAVAAALLVVILLPFIRKRRKEVFVEDE